ncbi:MAG: CCA tRNA nucleotidyltransferase [Hyphomicrobium sp.]|uniref:CCA tRNA nucleotidyltransferase n=1 Tax=Hyphomicrobium sp. TaxID=82 RepID=UPI00132BDAAC|nr:CCA tRNA nucleotidyltransferase [Hyphomicrobium sp.]KAB2941391.1 MAG: CCA tRNA nucleotidyltransferase [Hyphomicrobium sp.]MBZ0212042.1 CCA tRNA nucleotidyltransferase [Hyphomicrobium sp.]
MARSEDSAGLPSLAEAEWLWRPQTRAVFAALRTGGAEARAVGGAVRNALMGTSVKDVDIATTALPNEVMRLAQRAGLHSVPTGIEHGTVTVIADKVPFEVTTLRRDIETFGRHARVTFTTDWREDAMRRDFTMNALYCDAEGGVHDPLGGYADLKAKRVRFIGDARQRIREDFLRILRFFRFVAQYGNAAAPDADGLAAARAEKAGLTLLSGERIRAELLLLLVAPGAVAALDAMRRSELIGPLIGVAGDVGLVERLSAIEQAQGLEPDAVLRLAALASDARVDLRERLRLSSAEGERLANAARGDPAFDPRIDEAAAKVFLYRHGPQAFIDGSLLGWARSGEDARNAARAHRLRLPQRWSAPRLPVRGADVIALGVAAGPAVGRVVSAFEEWWIGAGFPSQPERISAKLGELARSELAARRDA